MWIIRNAQGDICGRFTNKPGAGNKMPDGSDEVPILVDENDAILMAEVAAFRDRVIAPPVRTVAEQFAASTGLTIEAFKAELAKS